MALAQRLRVKHSSSKLIDAAELARANEHRAPPTDAEGAAPAAVTGEPEAAAPPPTRVEEGAKRAGDKHRQQRSVNSSEQESAQRLFDRPAAHKPSGKAARTPSVSHLQQYRQQHQLQQQQARPHAKTSVDLPTHLLAHQHAAATGLQSPAPFQRPRQHSTASSSAHSYMPLGHDRSTVASSSSSGSARSDKPERAVDVLFHGFLALRRGGLLKVAEKRYYFLARKRPELFCCKDETSFQLWLASGHGLDEGDAFGRANGLNPVSVCTVLRADPGDQANGASGGHDRTLSIVASSSSKCTTLRFTAESSERAALWVAALREVQVTQSHPREAKLPSATDKKLLLPLQAHEQLRRKSSSSSSDHHHHHRSNNPTSSSSSSSGGVSNDHVSGASHAMKRRTSASSSSSGSSASKTPRVYATGRLQTRTLSAGGHRSEVDDDAAGPVSALAGSSPAAGTGKSMDEDVSGADARSVASIPNRAHRMDSNASFLSAMSAASAAQSAGGNVVLFVPAAGSSISVSDSKLARAKQELAALVARGGKRPSRRGGSSEQGDELDKNVAWRFGPPEYALSDLEYVRGKQREHDATPLESYVEECCQTFLMEATHKAVYSQWRSVCHDAFFLQVNDGARVLGAEIRDTDMFGLLYMTGVDLADLDPTAASASEDPRAVLTEAFADGFPMEVLEVFTQPPQCYFSWRHWGRFTGKFGGVRGDGALVEVRGFGQMTVDAGSMRDLRLFFKQKELFAKLQSEAQRISSARAAAVGANGSADGRVGRSMSVASVSSSTGGLPPPPPPPPPAPPSASSSQSPAPTPSPGATKTHKTPRAQLKTDDIIAGLADFTLEAKQNRKKTR